MISRIKNKVQKFEQFFSESKKMQQEEFALIQLMKLFDSPIFLPLTVWSISPKEVLHICNDIVINKRKSIIEFGSGFSTFCIAQVLKVNNIKASFISVESDKIWSEDITAILNQLGLADYVQVIYAPISDSAKNISKKEQTKWYDTSSLDQGTSTIDNFDLVIVDGPFGGLTPFARYSAVPYLKSRLANDFAIFLDDSNRKEEKEIALSWKTELDCKTIDKQRYTYFSSNKQVFDITPYGM